MPRRLRANEAYFLTLYLQVAKTYEPLTKNASKWAYGLLNSELLEGHMDDGTLEVQLERFESMNRAAVRFDIQLEYSRAIPESYYNSWFGPKENPSQQAEFINRILYEGWKQYSKNHLPGVEYPVVKARANVFDQDNHLSMEFGIEETAASPKELLEFLCWFNKEWCADEAIAARFAIIFSNRPGAEYQISLTPNLLGTIQLFDGNF